MTLFQPKTRTVQVRKEKLYAVADCSDSSSLTQHRSALRFCTRDRVQVTVRNTSDIGCKVLEIIGHATAARVFKPCFRSPFITVGSPAVALNT